MMLLDVDQPRIPTPLVGFDSGGEAFLSQGRVFRGIYSGNGSLYRAVLRTCEAADLFRFGIVATRESPDNPCPHLRYDLVLEHERIPFISYPHEWPGSMLKAAALFHIDLYIMLGAHGLTIKDWHPYNILFKGTEPVFVDFTSIIPIDNLQDEGYLTPSYVPPLFRRAWNTTSAHFYEMYRRMFVPYFLLPLYLMDREQHGRARTRMSETILNASGSVIARREVFPNVSFDGWRFRAKLFLKMLALVDRGPVKRRFLELLREEVQGLSASPRSSAYSNYYAAKNEELGFEPSWNWTDKQRVTYEAIKRFQPRTLLDIGCNTGWFSVLAANLGCQVVAVDMDEACVNSLYDRAKREGLPILPLVMDVTKPTPDVWPLAYDSEPPLSLIGGNYPLLLSADKRLRCDMVLALALVHHLALGQGLSFNEIARRLSDFTKKYLLVEFVAREDQLIVGEPSFFSAFNANPRQFDWYTLDNFLQELRGYFRQVEITEPCAGSRVILICTK
ncbi:MAG TPA: class I SAM-dependent methyltransferase [Nitrososphaera sp.]|nr:class I SAM-dependent methyltransferase [Nitrososphaera sp.]